MTIAFAVVLKIRFTALQAVKRARKRSFRVVMFLKKVQLHAIKRLASEKNC
jgi:hypothetical protein